MNRLVEKESEIISLLNNSDMLDLGKSANQVRNRLHSDKAFYTINGAITYSNSCELLCPICSFGRAKDAKDAYILTKEQIRNRAISFKEKGALEVHIIGGINHDIAYSYYIDMIKAIKDVDPKMNVVAFTVSECVMMSEITGKPLADIYKELIDAGVNALPGGGAEIFEDNVRQKITPKKLSGAMWLNAHKTAHKCGLKTNATMLYGHIEDAKSIANHLFLLRNLQDETDGFKAFVPLPFRRGASELPSKTSAIYDCKICSLARVVLDNFKHIRVPVTHFSDRFAQVLLNFGADDVGGTHWSEEVATSAGAKFGSLSEKNLIDCIESAGYKAVRTNSNYV